MTPKNKLIICILGNAAILCCVILTVIILKDDSSKYFRIGPNDDLIIISVLINNYWRYLALLTFITIINTGDVLVQEVGMPVLGFNIYNPDKKHITDFNKNELQIMANTMYTISSFKEVLMMVVAISQIDIALWGVFVANAASIITIRLLLNEKTFGSQRANDSMFTAANITDMDL